MIALQDAVNIPMSALIAGLLVALILLLGIIADFHLLAKLIRNRNSWNQFSKQLTDRIWTWEDGLYMTLVLGTLFAAMILASLILDKSGIILSESAERFLILTETAAMQIVAIFAIDHLRRKRQASLSECFGSESMSWWQILHKALVFYLAVMPPILITALAANLLLEYFGIPVRSQDVLIGFTDRTAPLWFRLSLVLLAIGSAPIVEELAFRGMLMPIIAKTASPAAAIIISSMFFSIVHGHLPAIAPLFVISVGFSLAYMCTGSIIAPIVMHAMFNGINLLIFFMCYGVS